MPARHSAGSDTESRENSVDEQGRSASSDDKRRAERLRILAQCEASSDQSVNPACSSNSAVTPVVAAAMTSSSAASSANARMAEEERAAQSSKAEKGKGRRASALSDAHSDKWQAHSQHHPLSLIARSAVLRSARLSAAAQAQQTNRGEASASASASAAEKPRHRQTHTDDRFAGWGRKRHQLALTGRAEDANDVRHTSTVHVCIGGAGRS
jgi:hypothetical protein